LKEVEIRAKDLERWYKNGCKLPDVLYDDSISPVIEKPFPVSASPTRHIHRSVTQQEYAVDEQIETVVGSRSIAKQLKHTNKMMEHVPVASPKCVAAGRDFDANKSLMGRLRPELLSDVCNVKQPPAPLRQLLQATCSALGGFILNRVQFSISFQTSLTN
jgi:hypothetical protein